MPRLPTDKPLARSYLGHKTGPGVRKFWRPETQLTRKIHKEVWTRGLRKIRWRQFKEAAGIDQRITLDSARKRFREKGIHKVTLLRWIFGYTDMKLSSAMHAADAFGITLDAFARAMTDAWERAERLYQTEAAMNEARAESHEDAETP